ncbi:MAG: type VI secretion system lipoprotein TssJ [Deltaproteobacteria bacterium]|jgi:type VI secretion system protein VasD|nr:type VI secretion system lipoprotein TssJ [Deltaproteobacteria bacterium]
MPLLFFFQKSFLTRSLVGLWLALMAGLALSLSGCGGPSLTLVMAGLPNANPDATGRPSPVIIQMYELRSDLLFKQAEMVPLFSDPTGVLGADLVALDELTVLPATAYTIEYEPAPETKFIGVMASFRQSAGKGPWKIIVPIDPQDQTTLAIELNSSSLILIPPDKAKKWDPAQALASYRESSRGTSVSPPLMGGPSQAESAAALAETDSENLPEASASRVFDYPPGPSLEKATETLEPSQALKKVESLVSQ